MNKNKAMHALKVAFHYTIPVLTGYIFLGTAKGMMMAEKGFSFIYPTLMGVIIYAGSLEIVGIGLLETVFMPLRTFFLSFLINARHLFYSIAMVDKYRDMGKKKPYLVYSLTDETFSVVSSVEIPEEINRGWFYFWISILDQSYWVLGSLLGGIFGSFIPFSLEGLEFVMTALFVVIFLNQWEKEDNHTSSLLGLGCSLLCLLIFGYTWFILPALILILISLTLLRNQLEKGEGYDNH